MPKPTSLPSAPQDAKPADMSGVTPPALPAGLRAAYDRVRANVQKQSAKPGNTYSFGTTLDQTTGKIVVDTDAPAAVVDQIIAAPPGLSATDRQAHQNIVVHAGKVGLESGRREDTPPYYGGAGIIADAGYCSAGYAIRNAAGNVFMVTAGHCTLNGDNVTTEIRRYFGTTGSGIQRGNGKDMALLSGQSYAPRIFNGSATTGASIPVAGQTSPNVGFQDYCHSGRSTGTVCGSTLIDTFGQLCTAQLGCTYPLLVFGGHTTDGGDSGCPWYSKSQGSPQAAFILGHHVGFAGSNMYAESFARVRQVYGNVTIVT